MTILCSEAVLSKLMLSGLLRQDRTIAMSSLMTYEQPKDISVDTQFTFPVLRDGIEQIKCNYLLSGAPWFISFGNQLANATLTPSCVPGTKPCSATISHPSYLSPFSYVQQYNSKCLKSEPGSPSPACCPTLCLHILEGTMAAAT